MFGRAKVWTSSFVMAKEECSSSRTNYGIIAERARPYVRMDRDTFRKRFPCCGGVLQGEGVSAVYALPQTRKTEV